MGKSKNSRKGIRRYPKKKIKLLVSRGERRERNKINKDSIGDNISPNSYKNRRLDIFISTLKYINRTNFI